MIGHLFRNTLFTRPTPRHVPFFRSKQQVSSPSFFLPKVTIARFSTINKPTPENFIYTKKNEPENQIFENDKKNEPENLILEKAKEDFKKGFITEETFKKLQYMNDDEAEQRKGFKSVSSVVGGKKVAKFGGLKDMRLKRWYTDVIVQEQPENSKWTVLLDDRFIVTKNEKGLFLPNQKIAMLVASEWEIQEGFISLTTMPMMMLTCHAIDDMPKFRDYYHNELIEFLVGDHVCFRNEDSSKDYNKQMEIHQPIVDWFHKEIGLQLDISKGCYVQNHPKKTVDTLNVYLSTLDDFTFYLFHSLVHSTKSIATALALWHNAISLEHAVSSASLEEDLNTLNNGVIEGSHDLKKAQSYCDIASAAVLLQVSGVPPPKKETLELLGDASVILETRERQEWENHKKLQEKLFGKLQEFISNEMKTSSNKSELESFSSKLEQRKNELEQEWTSKMTKEEPPNQKK